MDFHLELGESLCVETLLKYYVLSRHTSLKLIILFKHAPYMQCVSMLLQQLMLFLTGAAYHIQTLAAPYSWR